MTYQEIFKGFLPWRKDPMHSESASSLDPGVQEDNLNCREVLDLSTGKITPVNPTITNTPEVYYPGKGGLKAQDLINESLDD